VRVMKIGKADSAHEDSLVRVRRQWNSQLVASYRLKDIDGIHWSATRVPL